MQTNFLTEIQDLHVETLALFPEQVTLAQFLARQADTLLEAHKQQDGRVGIQVSNWHPKLVGADVETILAFPFTLDDARLTLASEYGFGSWQDVARIEAQDFNLEFEQAVDAVVSGQIARLTELLDANPNLVHTRSQFGHRATLLHYIAANGLETWRQCVPENAVDVARLLVERGADVEAMAEIYGGRPTTLALLMSSSHPAEAGLAESIAEVLASA